MCYRFRAKAAENCCILLWPRFSWEKLFLIFRRLSYHGAQGQSGPGRLPVSDTLTVGEQTVEYELIGHGKPCIIFLNGFGASFKPSWNKVVPRIADEATVLLYNRASIGKSSKATTRQTGDVVIATLRELLKTLQLEPPYILVGHSIGGLFANLFARMYPSETQAVVFVDSSSSNPDEVQLLLPHATLLDKMLDGLMEFILRIYPNSEVSVIEESRALVRGASEFPDTPVVVITAAKSSWLHPKSYQETWIALHRELVALTPSAYQVVTDNSGHFLMLTEPELVINAIRDVISMSPAGSR